MQINNLPKLVVIGLFIVFCGAAYLFDKMTFEQFAMITGPFVGYLVGNGIAAKNGQQAQPVIGAKPPDS